MRPPGVVVYRNDDAATRQARPPGVADLTAAAQGGRERSRADLQHAGIPLVKNDKVTTNAWTSRPELAPSNFDAICLTVVSRWANQSVQRPGE